MHMGDLKIVVAGCVAQQEGATLLRRVPEVDLVMGPQYANRWSLCANTHPWTIFSKHRLAAGVVYQLHKRV